MATSTATGNHPINGIPKPAIAATDGSVPIRLEIRDLQKNADQWNLYLLGLDALKKLDQTSELSFYGIAGVHGRPYRIWGGVANSNPSGSWQGYCTHSSILFAPWHRPFLALYEQTLWNSVQSVAAQFPSNTRARYMAAATTFRIPYWDWATQRADDSDGYFPTIVSTEFVNVITPTSGGKTTQIANPLYSTTFNPLVPSDFSTALTQSGVTIPYNQWPKTLRYPSDPGSASATTQESQVAESFKTNFPNLRDTVNALLTDPTYTTYSTFSNHQVVSDDPGDEGSLENVHDTVHGAVGGNGGHMTDLDYAAFDPAFWIHHANIDRIFAIWQALNLSSYSFDQIDPGFEGTYVMLPKTEDNLSTELSPFVDNSGKIWTPTTVASTETFNYAYPETQHWLFKDDSSYLQNIRTTIQKLYGETSDQIAADPSVSTGTTQTQQPATGTVTTYTDYITTIKTIKHGLGESYRVHIFLGDFDPDVTTWHTLDALAGIFMVFGRNARPGDANQTGCGKCQTDAQGGMQISGTVSLTAQLLLEVQKGNCPSMNEADVIPYLTKNLHWRVTLHDGSAYPREDVPGLVISLNTTEVTIPATGLPQRSGVYVAHPEVTAGRAAGSSAIEPA